MATPTTLPSSFTAGNVLLASEMNALRGAFRILQVVSTTKTDTFSSSTGPTWVDVTGLSVTITPSSTSSKILLLGNVCGAGGTVLQAGWGIRLTGGNAASYVGDTAGTRPVLATGGLWNIGAAERTNNCPIFYLDSPATTSATTYQVQARAVNTGDIVVVNRGFTDANDISNPRTASTFMALEVSA